jgi:hypothetical protein
MQTAKAQSEISKDTYKGTAIKTVRNLAGTAISQLQLRKEEQQQPKKDLHV